MVAPLVVGAWVGGTALVSLVAGYFAGSDEIINNQNSYQKEYITNETTYDFSYGYFEKGSNVSLTTDFDNNQNQNAELTAENGGDDKTLLLLSLVGLGVGAFFLWGNK